MKWKRQNENDDYENRCLSLCCYLGSVVLFVDLQMIAYKIFDLHIQEGKPVPKTLFRGWHGSRILPIGQPLKAEIKDGTDGSRQTTYKTGFHAYNTLEDVKKWLKAAKKIENRVVVRVKVSGVRKKPRAIRNTLLANWLTITEKDWEERIPAAHFVKEK